MSFLPLFPDLTPAPVAAPAWVQLSAPHRKGGDWRHASGWGVFHCGHPTANWPYYLAAPSGGDMVVSFNGLGFKNLAIAKLVVERILAGELVVTTEDCVENIARVLVTAFGEAVSE